MQRCYQINLQTGWGGGEVYTVFFTKALQALGIPTTLYVNQKNHRWEQHLPKGVEVVSVSDSSQMIKALREIPSGWLLFHSPLQVDEISEVRGGQRFLSSIAHMPVFNRNPERLAAHDYVIGVSEYVLDSLRAASIDHYHQEPLLGIAELAGSDAWDSDNLLKKSSRYDWDLRKGRDRFLSWTYPFVERCFKEKQFERKAGITLGLVSRLTPIKQFPLMFTHLAPVLAEYPEFNLEIFGAGGYASVRDLDKALRPIKKRVRYWGQQSDVDLVYRSIDYLMTGLPEKEALGLNVIEAQVCGTPVLAVNNKPFTETVADGITGLFYNDPRKDQGQGFSDLLRQLSKQPFCISPVQAADHLDKFSEAAFRARVERLCSAIRMKGFL